MKLVFLDFDIQNDLSWEWGKYPLKGFNTLLEKLGTINSYIRNNGSALHVAFVQYNRYLAIEKRSLTEPRYCELGTTGAAKLEESVTSHANLLISSAKGSELPSITDFVRLSSKTNKPYLLVEHREWDVFSNPHTEALLERLKEQAGPLAYFMYGISSDRSIKNFVESFRAKDKKTPLYFITDLSRSYSPEGNKKEGSGKPALWESFEKEYNVFLINTNDVLHQAFMLNHPKVVETKVPSPEEPKKKKAAKKDVAEETSDT